MTTPGAQMGQRFVPHEEIAKRAGQVTSGLTKLGIGRGDSVALLMRNDIAFLEASIGTRNLGGYPVPINWHLKADEVGYILSDSKAKALVIHADLLDQIASAIPKGVTVFSVATPQEILEAYSLEPASSSYSGAEDWDEWLENQSEWTGEPLLETSSMIYTSGTTGRPKGVRREAASLEQYQATLKIVGRVFGLEPGIRSIIPAPLYHSAPNAFALYTMIVGGFLVIMPRFNPEEFLALVEKHKVNRVQMVPTMFVRLLKLPEETRNKYDVSSLEYVVHAAAPCPPQVKEAMMEWWGPVIYEYYGSTESGAVTYCTPEDARAHPGTVGKPLDEAIVRVYDDEGNEVPAGEIGTIYCRLTTSTDFTYQNDDGKRESIARDGLITCGDVGHLNEEGYLFLSDRAADMVISGGVNIYPAEIEGVLIDMPGVRDCAVFGIPDEDFGEKLMAIVQPDGTQSLGAEDVQAFLTERVAGYKVPKIIEFRDDLPREDSGKLFKRKLREPYWADAGRKI